MLTPSLILITIGTAMFPGGMVVPRGLAPAFIGAGALLLIAGVGLGFAPVRWMEINLPGLKGEIDDSDAAFRSFYRRHGDRLHEFATLMAGDGATAASALKAAAARTRLDWQLGAKSDPMLFVLRALLKAIARPGLAEFLSAPGTRRLHREPQRHFRHRPETLRALAELPFARRAAFLLDALFSLSPAQIAALTGLAEDAVAVEVDAASEQLAPVLPGATEEHRAG